MFITLTKQVLNAASLLSRGGSAHKLLSLTTNLRPKTTSVRSHSSEVDNARRGRVGGEETIFDKIINRKIPANIIHEDEDCMAFRDVSPQAPNHFLVIPKKRIAMLDDAAESDKLLLGHLLLVAKKLALESSKNGYRIVINSGVDGCQSVYHLHVHVLSGRQLGWPPG